MGEISNVVKRSIKLKSRLSYEANKYITGVNYEVRG